ncbi:MAG: tetratricopeptide repeat protein [Alphaproteobacteria bacterium]|nr:tetratricopeptide repeat protein [Alphaproteobacteria bacterium]
MSLFRLVSCTVLCASLAACASAPAPKNEPMTTAMTAQGKALLSKGKKEEARDIYLSALARDKNNARAWNGLGVAYDLLGDRAKARDAYEHAQALLPHDITVANNLAHLYLEDGRPAEALKLLAPHINDKNAPSIVRQNYERAQTLLRAPASKPAKATPAKKRTAPPPVKKEKPAKKAVEIQGKKMAYATLGSFPTEGLAKAHLSRVKPLLEGLKSLTLSLTPDVQVSGGTPVFTLKAKTQDPEAVCRRVAPQGFTCTPYK